jgi:hypothetical protein
MRLPPSVRVELAPSRIACAGIVAGALFTIGVIAWLPFDPAVIAFAIFAVVVWAGDRIVVIAMRRGPRAVRALTLTGDRMIVVRTGDARLTAGFVRASTYVGARVASIVWQPDGALRSRAILVLTDMLPAEDFRRLRVLLRYSRSDVDEGEPLSQA